MMWRASLLGFSFASLAAPALACMPGEMTATAKPVLGEQCSLGWQIDEVWAVGLEQAKDAGSGIVTQVAYESDGCGTSIYLVVLNCATDAATIVGTESTHVMIDPAHNPDSGAIDRATAAVAAKARRKMALTPEMIIASAQELGLDFQLRAQASGKIKLMDKPVSLACGCKTYYPGS